VLTRRALLVGLSAGACVPLRHALAHTTPVYVASQHWLNHPRWCVFWGLALPHNTSAVWRDLIRNTPLTWTSVAGTPTSTSGVSPVTKRRGGFGEARCDGTNDHGLLADAPDLSPTLGGGVDGPFSVTFWANITNIAATQGLCSKWTNDGTNAEWLIFTDSSSLYWVSYAAAADGSRGRGMTLTSGAHQATWLHIACTYTGSETDAGFKMYVNAVQTDSFDAGFGTYSGNTNGNHPVRVGSYNAGNYCAGIFDDIRIYRRELVPNEVRLLWTDSLLGYPTLLAQRPLEGKAVAAAPSTRRRSILW
jgi:hypothetical protein